MNNTRAASPTSPSRSSGRPGSPGKRLAGRVAMNRFTETMLEQKNNDDLQFALKEKDVELQHTLNMLIGLNEKLEVFNDLKQDKAQHLAMIKEIENQRENLRVTITTTAKSVEVDREKHEVL